MTVHVDSWRKSITDSRRRIAVPLMSHPGITFSGHTVREAVTQGRAHFEAMRAVAQQYPTGAATMIMDLSVEAEAFGANVRFEENEVPSVLSRVVENNEGVHQLKIPVPTQGRLGERLLALKLAGSAIHDRPIFAECIGPLSLASRLFGVTDTMSCLLEDPELILSLTGKCTEFLITYCRAFKDLGAHGVVIAEPVAGMLSPQLCADASSRFVRDIVEAVQDDWFLVILHNCGDTDGLVPSMASTGASCLHLGNKCTIVDALGVVPSRVLVMGNVDPVGILQMGTPDQVVAATFTLLEQTSQFKNFVLSTGCDVPPRTPPQNIEAFFSALQEFNQQRST
jgi:uroporphyrinogen decarboxylase